MTKQLTKQRKQPRFVAIALLGILLGAQTAVFSFIDPGGGDGMPPSFDYGFNSEKAGEILFPGDGYASFAYMVGRCTAHYSKASDVNECEYGGLQAG